jgi:hypothetical protein
MTSASIPTENVLNAAKTQLRLLTRKAEALEETIKEQEQKHREKYSTLAENYNSLVPPKGKWWQFWRDGKPSSDQRWAKFCALDDLSHRQDLRMIPMYKRASALEKLAHQLQNIRTLAEAAQKAGQSLMNVSAEDAKLLKL